MSKFDELHEQGQSVWFDYIRRDMLTSGELAALVAEGIRGLTSNPTIFQKAIASSDQYDDQIRSVLETDPAADAMALFEAVAVNDIRAAADLLRPVFDASSATDGHVSLEVSPHLAHDTAGTIADAKRLWGVVDRPNLMIKVPATSAGIPAIEELIASGINVNATLMFSLADYEAVAQAYLRGLHRASEVTGIASVASFFVSRVDSKTDAALEKVGTDEANALMGRIAVANAKLAYARYQELFEGSAFEALAGRGAQPQRVLWASTSTKNPAYADTLYVDELVGPNTVNTMPPATVDAFRDHGVADGSALTRGLETAREEIGRLAELGIDFDQITAELQTEGVIAFADSFDDLLATIDAKRIELLS
ncbi:MAG: transaldolase [Acidimicrobiia bacterium]|nr:transaldolase [Acidimicrobiia bacterium]